MSVKHDCRIVFDPSALERHEECGACQIGAAQFIADPNGSRPCAAVIARSMIDQEIGRLLHAFDDHEPDRTGDVDDERSFEFSCSHPPPYASSKAKASAGYHGASLLAPMKEPIHPHACVFYRLNEVGSCNFNTGGPHADLSTSAHCICPVLAIVIRPMIEEEVGCLICSANQMRNLRVAEGNGDGSSKSVRVHSSNWVAIAAEVSAANEEHFSESRKI